MTFEYVADAAHGPRWRGLLPGTPEGFFQRMGTPADSAAPGQPPFVPDLDRIMAAGRRHKTTFLPGFDWPDA